MLLVKRLLFVASAVIATFVIYQSNKIRLKQEAHLAKLYQ